MIQSLYIPHFRGFQNLKVESLGRINLITGKNNTGKTSLLEAIRILLGVLNDQDLRNFKTEFRAGVGVSDATQNFWSWLFRNKETSKPLQISAGFPDGGDAQVQLGSSALDPIPARQGERMIAHGNFGNMNCLGRTTEKGIQDWKTAVFTIQPTNPNNDAIEFNRIVLMRKKAELVKLLKPLEPRLETLETLQTTLGTVGGGGFGGGPGVGAPLIYADVGLKEMIPVVHMGQGFCRLLAIFAEILSKGAKVLLIDEIENGIHYSVMQTVWEGLLHAARELDLQIFATTHSWECIAAADKAARKGPGYDLRLIRLDRVEGVLTATTMDEQTLETARELDWELR